MERKEWRREYRIYKKNRRNLRIKDRRDGKKNLDGNGRKNKDWERIKGRRRNVEKKGINRRLRKFWGWGSNIKKI